MAKASRKDRFARRYYFPFFDGAVSYDCVACGSKCCRGAGLSATRREFEWIAKRHPTVRLQVLPNTPPYSDEWVALDNLRPGCTFLDDKAGCTIQRDHGRARKPLNCRTFPANWVSVHGDGLAAVDFNILCPLELWQPTSGGHRVWHRDLRADLDEQPSAMRVNSATGPVEASGRPRIDDAVVDREEWLRDQVGARPQLGLLDYAAVALWAGRRPTPTRWPTARQVSADRARIAELAARVVHAMDAATLVDPERLRVARLALIHAPRVRLQRLLREPIGRAVPDILADAVRNTVAAALYLEVSAAVTQNSITIASLDDVVYRQWPIVASLSRLDQVPTMPPLEGDSLPWGGSLTDGAARAVRFIYNQNDDAQLTLADVMGRVLGKRAGTDRRFALLRQLASVEPHLRWDVGRAAGWRTARRIARDPTTL